MNLYEKQIRVFQSLENSIVENFKTVNDKLDTISKDIERLKNIVLLKDPTSLEGSEYDY